MEKSAIQNRIAELETQLKEIPVVENKDGLDEEGLLDKKTAQATLLIQKRDQTNVTTETKTEIPKPPTENTETPQPPIEKQEKPKWTAEDEKALKKIISDIGELGAKIAAEQKEIDELDRQIAELEKEKQAPVIENLSTEITTNKEEEATTLTEEKKEGPDKKEKEPFVFSIEDIKNKALVILKEIKAIQEIKYLNIITSKDSFVLEADLMAKKGIFTTEVLIKNVKIENTADGLKVNPNYELETNKILNAFIRGLINSKLDQFSQKLKEVIEKETGQSISKVWIENGELKAI
jgi:hypothetical protein